jgi:hypothetical protein
MFSPSFLGQFHPFLFGSEEFWSVFLKNSTNRLPIFGSTPALHDLLLLPLGSIPIHLASALLASARLDRHAHIAKPQHSRSHHAWPPARPTTRSPPTHAPPGSPQLAAPPRLAHLPPPGPSPRYGTRAARRRQHPRARRQSHASCCRSTTTRPQQRAGHPGTRPHPAAAPQPSSPSSPWPQPHKSPRLIPSSSHAPEFPTWGRQFSNFLPRSTPTGSKPENQLKPG